MKKQEKIDLMVREILKGEKVPIIFDPYENETDCMILWDRFSLGSTTELYSYPHSNDWCARKLYENLNGEVRYFTVDSVDRKTAMCECMVKAAKNWFKEKGVASESYLSELGIK